MELGIDFIIKTHKQAIADREVCLNTIEKTQCNTEKDKINVCNLAIAARAYLDVIDALGAILANNGVIFGDERYFKDITPEEPDEVEDSKEKKSSKEK